MTTATRSLWPEDIRTDDVKTPVEILNEQAELLEKQTNGLLVGVVVEHVVEDRKVIGFEVTVPRLSITARLFEVQQSLDLEYPVAIVPPKVTIPDFLKREVYRAGTGTGLLAHTKMAEQISVLMGATGSMQKNEWVADSPAEFVEKLQRLLASEGIKAMLFSLLSRASKKVGGPPNPPANGG